MAKNKSRFLRWFVWGIAGTLLIFAALFAAIQLLFQINSVPADLRKPPAWLGSAAASGPAAGASKPGHAFWNNPDPPKTYEDYVRFQLEANPGDQGAALYLELVGEFVKGNTADAWGWGKAFQPNPDPTGRLRWKPGDPLTPEQTGWLEAHRDYIEKLMRMTAAGGPPNFTRAEILALDGSKMRSLAIPNSQLSIQGARMLAADSQRLRAAGDVEGAFERLAAIYPLRKTPGDQFIVSNLIGALIQTTAGQSLDAWLRDDPPDPALARRIAAVADANRMSAQPLTASLELEFATTRATMVDLMSKPLGEAIRVMGLVNGNGSEENYENLLGAVIDQPGKALPAIVNGVWLKANAAGMLRESDDFTSRYLPVLRGPYAGIKAFDLDKEIRGMSRSNFFLKSLPGPTGPIGRSFAVEAAANIDRAALRTLSGETIPASIDPAAADWAQSPWRDPFTEAPLRIEDEGDATMIYSLGPDLKDQRGFLAYDPSNGTMSEGDVLLRVPKRKPAH